MTYVLAIVVAFAATAIATPLVIRLAMATGFLDKPQGYKGHAEATPYLGGLALSIGVTAGIFAAGDGIWADFSVLIMCVWCLWFVGTVDDKVGLGPLTRVVIEAGAAFVLWSSNLGWDVGLPAADLALTVVWVIAIVNAVNLMDNMDGACSGVAGASLAGIGLIAVNMGFDGLGAVALAGAGACAAFLRFNLAVPRARVFLGDGGSMPLGLVVATAAMSLPVSEPLGVLVIAAAAPVVALPILDTVLVSYSRRRRGLNVLSGGRDHLTHRLKLTLGSARPVVAVLAAAQGAMCLLALLLVHAEAAIVAPTAMLLAAIGAYSVWVIDQRTASRLDFAPAQVGADEPAEQPIAGVPATEHAS